MSPPCSACAERRPGFVGCSFVQEYNERDPRTYKGYNLMRMPMAAAVQGVWPGPHDRPTSSVTPSRCTGGVSVWFWVCALARLRVVGATCSPCMASGYGLPTVMIVVYYGVLMGSGPHQAERPLGLGLICLGIYTCRAMPPCQLRQCLPHLKGHQHCMSAKQAQVG